MKINTINKKEIEKFSRIAEEWWDPAGKLQSKNFYGNLWPRG